MTTFIDELLLGGKAKAKGPGVLRQAIAQESGRSREPHYAFLEGDSEPDELPAKASQALKQAKVEANPTQVFRELNGFSGEFTGQEADQQRRVPTLQSVELDQPLPLTPPVSARPINQTSSRDFVPVVDPDEAEVRLDDVITGEVFSSFDNNLERQNQAELAALHVYNDEIASTGEILPYGIKSVWGGQDISKSGNIGDGTYAFIIDSGVLDTTGDLLVNKAWSRSWISGESAFTDGNGHGTHVAGTIAALANGVGVVGVAPGAEVISLKVFDSFGGGASYSTIISAINHAVDVINTNRLDKSKTVINMSLGGWYSSGLDAAVKNAADQGIQFAIAAGNSGDDADYYSPASAGDHANVYTVSAVDNNYQMPWWSNWDDPNGVDDVDVAAPGVGVLSYYSGGNLARLSGTSMASPHVAGLVLAGGINKGDMVQSNWAGYADPFAMGGVTALGNANLLYKLAPRLSYGQCQVHDINGDGISDLVYQNDSNEFWLATGSVNGEKSLSTISHIFTHGGPKTFIRNQNQFADINGDGRIDAIYQGLDNNFWCNYGTSSGFTGSLSVMQHGGPAEFDAVKYIDIDGDGADDMIYHGADNRFWVTASSDSGFNKTYEAGRHGGEAIREAANYGDFNGDGKADMLFTGADNTYWVSYSNNGVYDNSHIACKHGDNLNYKKMKIADIDGDNKDDLLYHGSNNDIWLSRSSGRGFYSAQKVAWFGDSFDPDKVNFVDVNGDAMDDLVYQDDRNQVWIYNSNGNGFNNPRLVVDYFGTFNHGSVNIADVNGDSQADILYQDGGKMWLTMNSEFL